MDTTAVEQVPPSPLVLALVGIGFLVAAIFGIILIIKGFKTSVAWGLVVLLVPFGVLVFAIANWGVAGKAFLGNLLGGILMCAGIGIQVKAQADAFNDSGRAKAVEEGEAAP